HEGRPRLGRKYEVVVRRCMTRPGNFFRTPRCSTVLSMYFLHTSESTRFVTASMRVGASGPGEVGRFMARVLIIEDDTRFREVVGLALRESGHDVSTAANPDEAIRAVEQGIDLALLDLGLPEKDVGFSILDELKRRRAQVPVIVLTGEKDMAS